MLCVKKFSDKSEMNNGVLLQLLAKCSAETDVKRDQTRPDAAQEGRPADSVAESGATSLHRIDCIRERTPLRKVQGDTMKESFLWLSGAGKEDKPVQPAPVRTALRASAEPHMLLTVRH